MTDKILEAVKALGGDLENTYGSMRGGEEVLVICDDGDYIAEKMKAFKLDAPLVGAKYICTIPEFNTAAEEWLKQAYMHNAAIDLGWDVNTSFHYDGEMYLFRNNDTGVYVDRDDKNGCNGRYTLICKSQEFIDYCAANKPQNQVETPEEKEALDMIETRQKVDWNGEGLPPVGVKVKYPSGEGEVLTGVDIYGVVIVVENGGFKKVTACACKPLKSPRDKAVDVISEQCKLTGLHSTSKGRALVAGAIYDWLKSLTPEQKKEFGL